VQFIHAAVHHDERHNKSLRDMFIERVHNLRNHKFTVLVSLVMTPEIVQSFPQISDSFEAEGITVIPKVMRGKFRGKKYPESYSPEEKLHIIEYLEVSRRKNNTIFPETSEIPTVNPLTDCRLLTRSSNYIGKMCGSGHTFVRVEPDGTVLRCSSRIHLGNILQKNVRFLPTPMPCYSRYCPYYCEKYTSPPYSSARESTGLTYSGALLKWIQRIFTG
jgi:MoaA/NifB/PqqE/SkfB family radical SAM enzyme